MRPTNYFTSQDPGRVTSTELTQVDQTQINSLIDNRQLQNMLILFCSNCPVNDGTLINFLVGKTSLEECSGERTWAVNLLMRCCLSCLQMKSGRSGEPASHYLSWDMATTLTAILQSTHMAFDDQRQFSLNNLLLIIEEPNNKGILELQNADLRGIDLQGANLQGVDLRKADLWRANLWGADLRGANLEGASLRRANLREADLRGANLQGSNLQWVDLRSTCLLGAQSSDPIIQREISQQNAKVFEKYRLLLEGENSAKSNFNFDESAISPELVDMIRARLWSVYLMQ